ncbi:hypothetical protein PR202_ga18780 [Eleusine coracana subsp. coracana]|uniref:STAS domain-containing protein n=1 Tax=Eleusine coracana subsp. coracana TaxID=191504 RepID=A0AAV5CU34_ELECO|nr:hypothetical protein PR202_ga18780 [Eleusine coracana subsp. coracana]
MEVHKVSPPPPQSTVSKLKVRLKETLFPDDPFRVSRGSRRGCSGSWQSKLEMAKTFLGFSMRALGIRHHLDPGAFSRSAVNHNAGCKTAMSNVIMALTVMITLLFLMPLFVYTPNVVLGAIIIAAVIGLIDIPAVYHIWKMDKMDFLVCVCAFAGVIFISVQEGLAIAIGISIFRVLIQITRPKIMVQGNIRGTDIYRSLHQYKDAQRIPGFLILATEAPINFANSNYLNERIKRWIEEETSAQNKQAELRFIILDLSGVPAIDTSGVAFLIDIKKSIEKRGLELVLVNPTGEVMEKIQRANEAHNHFRSDCLYLTTGEAVASLSTLAKMTSP